MQSAVGRIQVLADIALIIGKSSQTSNMKPLNTATTAQENCAPTESTSIQRQRIKLQLSEPITPSGRSVLATFEISTGDCCALSFQDFTSSFEATP